MSEMLLTPKEVAERLRVHLNTVYRYLGEDSLKGRLLAGHTWRISERQLNDFLEAGLNKLNKCPKGGQHEWGTDGAHSNVFCKKCFVNKSGG